VVSDGINRTMREFIKIIEAVDWDRLQPETPEILDEIEVVAALGTHPNPAELIVGAVDDGDDVLKKTFGEDVVYAIGEHPDAYGIVRTNSTNVWLLELWTRPDQRGKGLAGRLIKHMLHKHKHLFVDMSLTTDSIRMIEKMVNSGVVKAGVLDTVAGEITDYNPDNPQHRARPMYDMEIPGIDRPPLPVRLRTTIGWVLQEGVSRRGILSPYVRLYEA